MKPTREHICDGEWGYRYTVTIDDEETLRYGEEFLDAIEDWVRDGLYYPYHDDRGSDGNFEHHEHRFEDVLKVLLFKDNAEHMSLEGYEDYYGKEEIRLFNKVKEKTIWENSRTTDEECSIR